MFIECIDVTRINCKSPRRSVWILSSLTIKDFGALPRVGQESYFIISCIITLSQEGAGRENSDFASLMYVITSLPCFLAMCLLNGQSFPACNLSSYPYAKFYVTSGPQGKAGWILFQVWYLLGYGWGSQVLQITNICKWSLFSISKILEAIEAMLHKIPNWNIFPHSEQTNKPIDHHSSRVGARELHTCIHYANNILS